MDKRQREVLRDCTALEVTVALLPVIQRRLQEDEARCRGMCRLSPCRHHEPQALKVLAADVLQALPSTTVAKVLPVKLIRTLNRPGPCSLHSFKLCKCRLIAMIVKKLEDEGLFTQARNLKQRVNRMRTTCALADSG